MPSSLHPFEMWQPMRQSQGPSSQMMNTSGHDTGSTSDASPSLFVAHPRSRVLPLSSSYLPAGLETASAQGDAGERDVPQ